MIKENLRSARAIQRKLSRVKKKLKWLENISNPQETSFPRNRSVTSQDFKNLSECFRLNTNKYIYNVQSGAGSSLLQENYIIIVITLSPREGEGRNL